jgi:hypothetical protein
MSASNDEMGVEDLPADIERAVESGAMSAEEARNRLESRREFVRARAGPEATLEPARLRLLGAEERIVNPDQLDQRNTEQVGGPEVRVDTAITGEGAAAPNQTLGEDRRVAQPGEEAVLELSSGGDVDIRTPSGEVIDAGSGERVGATLPEEAGEATVLVDGEPAATFEIGAPESGEDLDLASADRREQELQRDERIDAAFERRDEAQAGGGAEPEGVREARADALGDLAETRAEDLGLGADTVDVGDAARRGTDINQSLREEVAAGREGVTPDDVDLIAQGDDRLTARIDPTATETTVDVPETNREGPNPSRREVGSVGTTTFTAGPDFRSVDAAADSAAGVDTAQGGDRRLNRAADRQDVTPGEVRAAVGRFGQQQLDQQDQPTGDLREQALVEERETRLTAQDQFSTGRREAAAGLPPTADTTDLGDTPIPVPETERVGGQLTAQDQFSTGDRAALERTGDTERLETILEREARQFQDTAGETAAAAQPDREVGTDTQRRLRASEQQALTGGTDATAAAVGRGVGGILNPFAAAESAKEIGETVAFTAGTTADAEGLTLGERTNIVAGEGASRAQQTERFASQNPRQFTTSVTTAGAATFGAAAVSGAGLTTGLRAELDPRIGPLGETIESRSLGLRSRSGLREFLADESAQADLTGGRRRGAGDADGDDVPDEVAGVEPLPGGDQDAALDQQARQRRIRIDRRQQRQEEITPPDTSDVEPSVEPSEPDRPDVQPSAGESPDIQPSFERDFSDAGPTPGESEAFRSALVGDDDAELSPRERQLRAQRDESADRIEQAERQSVDEGATAPDAELRLSPLGREAAAGTILGGVQARVAAAQEQSVTGGQTLVGDTDLAERVDVTSDVDSRVDEAVAQDVGQDLRETGRQVEDTRGDVTDRTDQRVDTGERDITTRERDQPRDFGRDFEDIETDLDDPTDPDVDDPGQDPPIRVDPPRDPAQEPPIESEDDDEERRRGGLNLFADPFTNPVTSAEEFLGGDGT